MNQPWVYMCSPSWTPLPPPSPSHPSGSPQYTGPEHPVSCIKPGLVIYFTYTCFNAVLSNHPTLTFSHRVQKSVLYIYVSFAVSHIEDPGSEGKASACNSGDLGLIPGLGRSPGEGNGNPLHYSCLENPMDGGA